MQADQREQGKLPGQSQRRFWLVLVPVLLVGWLAAETFIATSAKVNRGKFVPPLDDTYIYYQYAKQIARGQLYRYQDGEAVSTGSTSTLYPLLMAPAWKLGLRGSSIFWAGFYVNVLGLLLAMGFLYASLRRLLPGDPWMAPLGALLLAGNGWFLWGIASGMDTGVLAASLAATMHGVVLYALEGRSRVLAIALAVLAVSRPEGLVLAWATTLVLTLQRRFGSGSDAGPPAARWPAARAWLRAWLQPERRPPWPLLAGLLAGTAPTLILAAASGHLSTNGMLLKSHATHLLGWVRYLDSVSRTLIAIPERLLWVPSAWLRGPMMVALLIGLGSLCAGLTLEPDQERADGSRRSPGWVAAVWCLSIFLFYGFLMGVTEQHNRYYMAYSPLVVLLVLAGLHTAALPFPAAARPALRRAGAVVLVLVGLSSVGHWAREFAFNCKDLAEQHVVMSGWIEENTAPEASLAINDAGALAYLSGRRVVDLFGLVSNDFRAPGYWRAEGYIWEALERRRPTHLVIYPGWFDDLQRLPCLKRVFSVDLRRDSLLGDREKVAYEILWRDVPEGGLPRAVPVEQRSWKLVDVLDVADAVSEKEHHYRVAQGDVVGGGMFKLRTFHAAGLRIIDGGRAFSGIERFRPRGLQAGAPLLIGVRSDLPEEMSLEVEVGEHRQAWRVGTPAQRAATEAYLLIPGTAVGQSAPEIRVRPVGRPEGFTSFHYFFLQPRS